MGKHSHNKKGLFGPGAAPHGGPHPAKRRVPPQAAGKRQIPMAGSGSRSQVADEGYSLSDPRARRKGALESAPARLKVEKERRRSRAKRVALIVASVLGVVLVVSAAGIFAYAKHIQDTMQRPLIVNKEELNIELAKAEPQKPYNVLIMGFDRRPPETIYRSDTMILARIDPKTKQVWMISIPRDMRVEIPGHGVRKINDAYAVGQEQLAIDTVKKLTGVPINHYMAVNFTGFQRAVNAMGGVWVDVPTEINDKKADRSPGHRAAHVDAGYQLLDGEHALTFVRSRAYADADFSRMKNQQLFFRAVADQIATKTSVAKIPRIVSAVAPYISTDMSLIEMLRTAQALKGAGSSKVYTATLPGDWRSPYIWPNETGIDAMMAKFKKGQPFEAKTATKGVADTDTVAAKKPSDITITVRNGAGIAGCAKQAASILKARAFQVKDVGNTDQFVYDDTLVVYKSDKAAAQQVASTMPPGTKLVESRGMYSFTTDVLLVVGKDWDLERVPMNPVQTN